MELGDPMGTRWTAERIKLTQKGFRKESRLHMSIDNKTGPLMKLLFDWQPWTKRRINTSCQLHVDKRQSNRKNTARHLERDCWKNDPKFLTIVFVCGDFSIPCIGRSCATGSKWSRNKQLMLRRIDCGFQFFLFEIIFTVELS